MLDTYTIHSRKQEIRNTLDSGKNFECLNIEGRGHGEGRRRRGNVELVLESNVLVSNNTWGLWQTIHAPTSESVELFVNHFVIHIAHRM